MYFVVCEGAENVKLKRGVLEHRRMIHDQPSVSNSGTIKFFTLLLMIRNRRGLKSGDVVWAGAYPAFLLRQKNSNRWVVEYFGFSNPVGTEKIQNLVAFHINDHAPCPQGESDANFAEAMTETIQFLVDDGCEWGADGRRTVPPSFAQKYGLVRHVDAAMDRTVYEEIDEPIEEEYEVEVQPKQKKSAQKPMIFFVAVVIVAVFILWYFM
ncbi:unnamed protein product [Caenorhabditis nigoni]